MFSKVLEDVKPSSALENGFVLPWGQPADRQTSTAACDVTPGEFVLRTLFAEFTVLAEKKIETVLTEPLVSLGFKRYLLTTTIGHICSSCVNYVYNYWPLLSVVSDLRIIDRCYNVESVYLQNGRCFE